MQAVQTRQEPEDDFDEERPLTRKELKEALKAERETERSEEQKLSKKYHQDYALTWAEMAKGLSDDDYNSVMAEAEETKYDPSDSGAIDAKLMFKEVQLRVLKKQLVGRKNPLENNKPKPGIGTVTTQKVPDRETVLPKLDAPAQSYLSYISREDGAEKATKIHKSLV